ncbi:MAG: hypothetical protein N5P05_003885 [Chroococcopsis gigantea SAG 12.99]|jgi:predicted house-cleaning noncanonical NTP pyrophosphatase (MazG superfamily)|nr:nucleoside triphosphate pyrophosphohydrolase [Chlorogloea purpurea SAG 13.99]MDV3002279.1 hypothetical protein [Chroococcopsis gigantea SAG 12.99]
MIDRPHKHSRQYHNKLVRDRIPQIIADSGNTYEVIDLDESEFLRALKDKLVEEAQEVRQADPDELVTELADLYEVIDTLIEKYNLSAQQIKAAQEKRRRERGAFEEKIYLLWTENNNG